MNDPVKEGATPKETRLPAEGSGEIPAAKEDVATYVERLKRLQAEFDNYKKRTLREMTALEERVGDREVCDVLPVFDNLRRALEHLEKDGAAPALVEGVRKVVAQFEQILAQKGVSPLTCLGERFDPAFHEALVCVPSDRERDTILEEFERGYLRSGRVLRPSKVKVSRGDPEAKEA